VVVRWGLVGLVLGWLARGWWERSQASQAHEEFRFGSGHGVDEVMSDVPPAAAFARGFAAADEASE
jgi:hypothetical protein